MSKNILLILLACVFQLETSNGSYNEMYNCAVKFHGRSNFLEDFLLSKSRVTEDDVKFFLFKRDHPYPYQIYLNDESRLQTGNFEVRKPTKIVIHGYQGGLNSRMSTAVKDAFGKSGDFNVIVVDWEWAQYWGVGHRIPLSYPAVVKKLGDVADFVKSMIVFLENYGMDLQSTTVVGHSLGAHVAGIAGYGMVRKLNNLVGLDPARPLFSEKGPGERLSNESATHVEVIHTEMTSCGLSNQLGHFDFYPNSGLRQPGCSNNRCSHSRYYHFYAESLANDSRGFYARRCADWKSMTEGRCEGIQVIMGAAEPLPKPEGIFYLATSSESPFALGPL